MGQLAAHRANNYSHVICIPEGQGEKHSKGVALWSVGSLESDIHNGKAPSIVSSHWKNVSVPNNKIHHSLIMQERDLLKYIWPCSTLCSRLRVAGSGTEQPETSAATT